MIFFIWKKEKCFVLEISRFLCLCETQIMLHNASYTFAYFFSIVRTIKMKFGQLLVVCMTNIFSMFLVECWSLETSSRVFYDFIKMTIQQDLAINPSHPNCSKDYWKLLPLVIFINWSGLMTSWAVIQIFIQICTLSYVLIPILTSQIW